MAVSSPLLRAIIRPIWRPTGLTPLAAAVALLLGGCAAVKVEVPTAQVNVPEQFTYRGDFGGAPVAASAASAASAAAPAAAPQANGEGLQRWWQGFNDPVLTQLIERGLQANTDIRVALNRIREARAYLTQAESAMYPTVEAGAAVVKDKYNDRGPQANGNSGSSTSLVPPTDYMWPPTTMPNSRGYGVGLGAAWELDLFRSRANKADSVNELVAGAHEQAHGAQMLVAGDIATNYLEARGIEQRMEVLQRGVAVTRRLVDYATARFNAGQAKRADVLRAQAESEYTQSQWSMLRMLLQHRLHRLATLTGQTTDQLRSLPPVADGAGVPATLPLVLPSEVLENRPDVRGAAFVLRSRAAELGEARSDMFPKFYLTFLGEDGHMRSPNVPMVGGILQTIGLGMRLPIFDAGRLRAKIAVQDARLDAATAEYERAILQALEDVENAYVARLALDTRTTRLDRAVSLATESAQQSEKLYKAGQELLQPVLEAYGKALQREDELVQSRTARATTTVLLYKSIGAGWSTEDTNAQLNAMFARAMAADAPPASPALPGKSAADPAEPAATTPAPASKPIAATTLSPVPVSAPSPTPTPVASPVVQSTPLAPAPIAPAKPSPAPVSVAPPATTVAKPASAAAPAAPVAPPPVAAAPVVAAPAPTPRQVVVSATANGPVIVAGNRRTVPLTAAPAALPQRTEFDPPEVTVPPAASHR